VDDDAFAGRIVHPRSDGVVYGPGVARAELAGLVDRVGATRTFLVTTGSLARAGLAAEVAGWLGGRCVGTFTGSREHTPVPVVVEAAAAARAAGADCLVSLGGSSVVDLTKGVALLLGEGGDLASHGVRPGAPRPDLRAAKPPHVAVPTTLSGAEFTAAAGITDPVAAEKQIYLDAKLLPRWVVFDSVLAATCPGRLWAGTGMKVVADALEALTSRRATPMTDALAFGALRLLVDQLPPAVADAADHAARGRCQFAVAMVFPQLATTGTGLVAALRHQLGGALGVPHGEASTIVLPHVMRLNLRSARAQRAYTRAANELGLASAEALVDRVVALTAELGLPGRLRDAGVARDACDDAAMVGHVVAEGGARANVEPVDEAAVHRLLAAAW
jgi:alcohol dehydrogenase class IV